MRSAEILTITLCIGLPAACSSPEEKAAKVQASSYKAQEKIAQEHLQLVGKYQKCVEQAAGDRMKIEACDSYLKAAEALQ